MNPILSVVMSVYNGQDFLSRSIESILGQNFTGFEFIIVNDGSTDSTLSIIEDYQRRDDRIIIIDQLNKGLTKSLNIGISHSKGKYIARQDVDDISLPERFEKQIDYFLKYPGVILLGTRAYENFDGVERIGRYFDNSTIDEMVFLRNPFAHTSVMFRKDVFLKVGMFDETFVTAQDFECWMRMAKMGSIIMLNVPLVKVYLYDNNLSQKRKLEQCYNGFRARLKHSQHGLMRILWYTFYHLAAAYLPRQLISFKRRIQNIH